MLGRDGQTGGESTDGKKGKPMLQQLGEYKGR